jgi:peptidoglycan/xylan/chitin deacetylase (PgdA/CDA1 family)
MYHQVDEPCSERERRFCTPPVEFRRQMAWLKMAGYQGVSLDEVLAHLHGKAALPKQAVHVTFDDGFVGVLEHALPALKESAMPATLFALPGRAGGFNEWMSQRDYPRRALLSAEHLRLLASEGVSIGSHTQTHARLTDIPLAMAKEEILGSKSTLEDLLGQAVAHFAYPFGQYNPDVRDAVIQAGFLTACSTHSGFNRAETDPFLLRRIDVYGTDSLADFRWKVQLGANLVPIAQRMKYYLGKFGIRLA